MASSAATALPATGGSTLPPAVPGDPAPGSAASDQLGSGAPHKAVRTTVFSDIDGTLVHYPEEQGKWGELTGPSVVPGCWLWVDKAAGRRHKLLLLPPSTSGAQGVISMRTLQELARIRSEGRLLVLVSGARLSTLLTRLPYLPAADAYICENGGRIFYSDHLRPTACPIVEDMQWRNTHLAAGPAGQEGLAPSERRGVLWDEYRKLVAAGWDIDTNSYTTSFRLRAATNESSAGRPTEPSADVRRVMADLPPELACSINLGTLDVYPATSGKENAARRVLEHFGGSWQASAFLCDDDNDMGLAALVAKVFLPSITADSVRAAAEAAPDKFVRGAGGGTLATEDILQKLNDYLGTFTLG